MADVKRIPNYVKYIFAANAGVASTLTCYPLDLMKIRMQVMGEGTRKRVTSWGLMKEIYKERGFMAFYDGLTASIVRQIVYTGTRVGIYNMLVDYYTGDDNEPPSFLIKCLSGSLAGCLGAAAGLPADVVMTRMASEAVLPNDKKRHYRNVFHAWIRIINEEGVKTLYKGFTPTVLRAGVGNMTQLVSYAETKRGLMKLFNKTGNETWIHFISSTVSSFASCFVCLPPDIAKIRMQFAVKGGGEKYDTMMKALVIVVKEEGILALWKGFTPMFIRNFPQFFVLFVMLENQTYYYRKFVLKSI